MAGVAFPALFVAGFCIISSNGFKYKNQAEA